MPPALTHARIYCMGTPLVWWLAALAPSVFLISAVLRFVASFRSCRPAPAAGAAGARADVSANADNRLSGLLAYGWLLLLGYLANWLPFVLVDRVAFVYHFLPSLFHALLLAGLLLDATASPAPFLAGRAPTDARLADVASSSATLRLTTNHAHAEGGVRWLAAGALVHAMAACCAFFAPLAYGVPLSAADFDARMWLDSWT